MHHLINISFRQNAKLQKVVRNIIARTTERKLYVQYDHQEQNKNNKIKKRNTKIRQSFTSFFIEQNSECLCMKK